MSSSRHLPDPSKSKHHRYIHPHQIGNPFKGQRSKFVRRKTVGVANTALGTQPQTCCNFVSAQHDVSDAVHKALRVVETTSKTPLDSRGSIRVGKFEKEFPELENLKENKVRFAFEDQKSYLRETFRNSRSLLWNARSSSRTTMSSSRHCRFSFLHVRSCSRHFRVINVSNAVSTACAIFFFSGRSRRRSNQAFSSPPGKNETETDRERKRSKTKKLLNKLALLM
jgi:hypothetical protein